MFQMSLDGMWALAWCAPGEGEKSGWPETGVAEAEHVAARVPGDVHVDLLEAGVIEEPLHGTNALDVRWMETRDWWYSRTFDLPSHVPGDRIELHFAGLDTTADVYLNGRHVGCSNNMHVPQTFDVTSEVRRDGNLLIVRVDAGMRAAAGKEIERYRMGCASDDLPRAWVRKPDFAFGWDWAPRLLTCGIWRGVEVRCFRAAALRDVCLRTALEYDGAARIGVLAEIENFTGDALDVRLVVRMSRTEAHDLSLSARVAPGVHVLEGEVVVARPDLWWPAPMGEPALYDVTASLSAAGRAVDGQTFCYGVREVSLVQEPQGEEGTSFIIAVNGRPVFCKGANWVPPDSILARIRPDRYHALVAAAGEANFNMFRVWGGGTFEDDLFYDLCDEHGILVWQDFFYCCIYYPDEDPEFMREARIEAERGVRRLRNHACIALWCGNNENQWLHQGRAAAGSGPERCLGDRLYDELLPDVCAELDPTRPYWPSSPYGGEDANSPLEGDRHSWDVSIGALTVEQRIDYRLYAEDRGKFVSEFGVLAPPSLDCLRRWLPPGQVNRTSEVWAFHNNDFERGTNQEALLRYWRPADDMSLEDYVRFSQMIQAEALRFAIEHWRRRKFRTAGALFWMYADCWAEVGWTIIDYCLGRKRSYYAVRRAFAPVLVSLQEEEDGVGVWLVNDTLEPVEGELTCGWLNVRTSRMTGREQAAASVDANEAAEVKHLEPPDGDHDAWMAFASLSRDGRVVSRSRHFLAGFHFNRLGLLPANVTCRPADGGRAVEVATDGFAWQVHLGLPPGAKCEDNDFDLLPGERRCIGLRGPRGAAEQVTARPLNDAEWA